MGCDILQKWNVRMQRTTSRVVFELAYGSEIPSIRRAALVLQGHHDTDILLLVGEDMAAYKSLCQPAAFDNEGSFLYLSEPQDVPNAICIAQ